MPKLNREKLSYKKEVRTVEKVRSNSFYDPIYPDDEYSKRYRGYHTYDYFGPKEKKMTNCPNCGAPLTGHKCEYCGTIIFDFAAIEVGKPVWINFKMGERWVLAHVLPESASMYVEPIDEIVMYADGAAQAIFRKPAPTRIEMDFIEIPTDKGWGHIVSERGVVPSTDLEGYL